MKGENIELWGNPNFGKDIIYVKDLCQMIFKSLFTNKETGIYNAGTGVKTTMQEQIEGIIKVFSPLAIYLNFLVPNNYISFVLIHLNIWQDLLLKY